MENASKALIIAGAILLSILIIGLGMIVFNQAKEALSGSNLDAEKAQVFNSKFLEYTGNNVSGVQVKNLLDLVINNNNTADTTGNSTIWIALNNHIYGADQRIINQHKKEIKNTQRYTVLVTEFYTEGYIKRIRIVANT